MKANPKTKGPACRALRLLPALLPWLVALSCSYSPDFAGGQLQCGENSACPKGYACATDGRCWKPADLTGSGLGGNGGGGITPDDFVGTWLFDGGTLNATCTDGPPYQRALTGDYIVVSIGGAGLLAQYYCDDGWSLRLPTGSNTATATSGQTCVEQTTSGNVTTTYTWSAMAFTVSTGDGQSGNSTGHIAGPFVATDASAGSCDVTFSGPLSKS